MPILTPCAEAGPAIKRPPIAGAASHINFISRFPSFELAQYFIALRPPIVSMRPIVSGAWPRVGEAADHHVEDRRKDQPEQGDPQHPEEHGDADRLAHFGARAA